MSSALVRFLDRTFYGDFQDNWDDKLFRTEILRHIDGATLLLDVGAGAGLVKEMCFRGIAGKVYGVDPDERVLQNGNLDTAFVAYGDAMPFFEDGQFDVVISDNVLEHIQDTDAFFREVYRVLKKGGIFLTKTPNRHHYVPLLASLTPTWFHAFYNKLRGREEGDTFPTHYRLNSRREQAAAAVRNGFAVKEIRAFEGRPEYLRLTFITYLLGILYERVVNALHLEELKVILISRFEKE
jgi:SAM-dependent methyltransferase